MAAAKTFMLPNAPTVICACSAGSARCWLSKTRHGEWTRLEEFEDPSATLHERDIGSDRPGRTYDSYGRGRHAMAPPTTARDTEKRRFANRVADYLNKTVAAGKAKHLVILAGPKLLGLLRAELSAPARAAVVFEASKNLAGLEPDRIRAYFR